MKLHTILLYFEPSKIMVAYQTIHKFNSQWERISSKLDYSPTWLWPSRWHLTPFCYLCQTYDPWKWIPSLL